MHLGGGTFQIFCKRLSIDKVQPYTLPSTLHPTLHPTPYPTPYTLHSTLHPTLQLAHDQKTPAGRGACFTLPSREREFFVANLLVRIYCIIEMILVDRPCAMGISIPFSM